MVVAPSSKNVQFNCPLDTNSMDVVFSTDDDVDDHMHEDGFDENVDNYLDDMFPDEVVLSSL